MITIVVAGRNDDYGGDFRQRFFRTAEQNSSRLHSAGIEFEYLLAEWNPLPDRPLLSEEFVNRVPNATAIVIPPAIHNIYSLNPGMSFHEMAAKNTALRRAKGEDVIVTNADVLFSDALVRRIGAGGWSPRTLYRAHRIDVAPSLNRQEMEDPGNQIPSGEGLLPPPYYLGAGGDFCLATRSLWHALRGFNERIRFSTRAKDWQFFLCAAAQGVAIEFIGDVYHLDHAEGFLHTAPEVSSGDAAHFGGWWDIEFGLPVMNSEDWGFAGLEDMAGINEGRIVMLKPDLYRIPPDRDRLDHTLRSWLSRPSAPDDKISANLCHVLCAAHRKQRRVICRLHTASTCVALAGMQKVAASFGVQVYCNWTWPEIPGFTLHPLPPEPITIGPRDWILEEAKGSFRLRENLSDTALDVLPQKRRILSPGFNPLLGRRLLRACLRMQNEGAHRIAIYGAGRHTEELLAWGLPDEFELVALVTSKNGEVDRKWGVPVVSVWDVARLGVDALVLSSSSFEPEMIALAEQASIPRVIPLYADWPKDLWCSARLNPECSAFDTAFCDKVGLWR